VIVPSHTIGWRSIFTPERADLTLQIVMTTFTPATRSEDMPESLCPLVNLVVFSSLDGRLG